MLSGDQEEQALAERLLPTVATITNITQWPSLTAPRQCWDVMTQWGPPWGKRNGSAFCTAPMLHVYNVTYSDCDTPWVMCACEDAEDTFPSWKTTWTRAPVEMRSWASTLILVNSGPGAPTATYPFQDKGTILSCGVKTYPTDLLHELGLILDGVMGMPSSLPEWANLEAKNNDTMVFSDDPSNTERFTETAIGLLLEKHGWTGPDFSRVKHQFDFVDKWVGKYLEPQKLGATCNKTSRARRPVSQTVHFNTSGSLIL